ncbi:MAG TPA: hypothetical protein VGN34_12315 [Ktedonobacteraceae bacterium]
MPPITRTLPGSPLLLLAALPHRTRLLLPCIPHADFNPTSSLFLLLTNTPGIRQCSLQAACCSLGTPHCFPACSLPMLIWMLLSSL